MLIRDEKKRCQFVIYIKIEMWWVFVIGDFGGIKMVKKFLMRNFWKKV